MFDPSCDSPENGNEYRVGSRLCCFLEGRIAVITQVRRGRAPCVVAIQVIDFGTWPSTGYTRLGVLRQPRSSRWPAHRYYRKWQSCARQSSSSKCRRVVSHTGVSACSVRCTRGASWEKRLRTRPGRVRDASVSSSPIVWDASRTRPGCVRGRFSLDGVQYGHVPGTAYSEKGCLINILFPPV
eukprot:gene15410-biopygen18704